MKEICIACGMPMETKDQFAMGDESKEYCCYCARPDGSMQSYDEKLDSYTQYVILAQGLGKEDARELARELMSELPAWKDHPK